MKLPARGEAVTVLTVGFVLALLAAILLSWLTEEMLEGDTARFDQYVRAAIHSAASPRFTSAMLFFTHLGSVAGLGSILAVTVIVCWILHWRTAAVLIIVTMAGATILDEALKLGIHRPRPAPFFGLATPHSFSYPSGHALFSFTFFSIAASLVAARVRRRWLRVAIWIVAILIFLNIGFSRIYLGVHYPTDVIAGYLTGVIWVTAVSLTDRIYRARHAER
jgi:undecaprenyl-diphosphatase